MMEASLSTFFTVLDKTICGLLVAIAAAMVVVGFSQVFARYILGNSLFWSEEVMRYLYVWVTILGVPIAIKRRGFATLTGMLEYLEARSPAAQRVLTLFVFTLQGLFCLIMVVYGTHLVLNNITQFSPAMDLPMGGIYIALPLGGLLSLLYTGLAYWETRQRSADQ